MQAGRANVCGDMDQLATGITDLDWCLAIAITPLLGRLHVGDRAMRGHYASKVQDQAMVGVAFDPHPAACHLHVQARAHGRAQHGNQVDVGVIKSCGQHIGIGQRTQAPTLEVGQHSLALLLWRLACHALSSHPVLAQDFGNVLGVLDACAKQQPGFAKTGQANNLLDHALVVVVGIHSGLQLGLDKLTTTFVDASHIQLGLGHF